MEPLVKHLRQKDAAVLAGGYSRNIRRFEVACISTYFSLMILLAIRLWQPSVRNPWLFFSAVLLGYLGADFVSGFVHWAADTWGSTEMKLIGKALIRPFREHHVDQTAIVRHDFVETNGNNCMISIPVALMAAFIPVNESAVLQFAVTFMTALILWVFGTNQFHKWAHAEKVNPVIAFLQRNHLILPPAHHAIHHSAPYSKYYCITVGWLNKPLYKIGFFQMSERLITYCFGLLPRQDDIGELAALMAAPEIPISSEGSHGSATVSSSH